MGKIDNCGAHSDSLKRMAQKMLGTKKENGENVNSIDEKNIDNELYMGYQKILAYSKDGGEIAVALTTMEQLVSGGTAITEIPSLVETSIRTMELERERLDLGTGEEIKSIGKAAKVVAASGALSIISQFEDPNITFNINNLYNSGLQAKINALFSAAAVGNVSATKNIVGITQLTRVAQLFCNGGKNINSKAVLGWMRNVATLESPEAEEALIANVQYLINQGKGEGFQDLISEKDGKVVFDRDRLQQRFEQEVGKTNPKAAQMKNDDFSLLMDKRTQEAVDSKKYQVPGMTIERFGKEEEQKANERIFSRNMVKAMDAGEIDLVRQMATENPGAAKSTLGIFLKAQENPSLTSNATKKVQERCMILGDVMSEIYHNQEIDKKQNEDPKDITSKQRKVEDDEMIR